MTVSSSPLLKFASKSAPLHKRLSNVYNAGFRHVEIFLTSKHLDEWKKVSALSKSYDLSYGLHFPNRASLNEKQLSKAIKLYHHLECESMVIHQPMFDLYGRTLLAMDSSLCLAVENHQLSQKAFQMWAESNQWLTLDVEHLWKYTLKQAPINTLLPFLKKTLKQHGHQIRRVHLPGYEPGSLEHRPLHFNPKLARKTFTALSKIGFQGLLVSETRPSMQTLEFLDLDVSLYQSWEKKRKAKTRKSKN